MEKRRFLHICYNAGAALILIGAMFKILHLPYGNQILMIAMSAEAVIFLLSAFDYESVESGTFYGNPLKKVPGDPQIVRTIELLQGKIQEMQKCMEELERRIEEQRNNENEEEFLI